MPSGLGNGYQRNLPHFEGDGRVLFVTFSTHNRWILPESARSHVLRHCLHDHGTKLHMHCALVMPDHVHLIYNPLPHGDSNLFSLREILNGIKGASAHTVNRLLQRSGRVWQDESFDHVLRSHENLVEKIDYVRHNPVRKGLCGEPEDYPWLWVNEESHTAEGGCATVREPDRKSSGEV